MILLGVGFGCASTGDYVYQPAEQASALASGYPAAYYLEPPERPTGDVRVASMGLRDVQPPGGAGTVRVLNVRMIISNANGVGPWQLDTRNVLLQIPNEGQSRPLFANADGGELPIVSIPPGQQKTVDLYYPLPRGYEDVTHVPQFDVTWQLGTPQRVVAQRTPFEAVQMDNQNAYDTRFELALGWGPYWYWDPFWPYPGYAFHHTRPVFIGRHFVRARPVAIARPHGRYR